MLSIREHEPLARYTSWKIGGPAHSFADTTTPEQLREVLAWARERALPIHLLGGGSNTLVLDHGFPGLVVRYRAQDVQITAQGETALARIAAGAPTAGTVRRLVRQGWAGLQWAEGVPGTIGGAVYGNAGCYGGDIAGTLVRAWLLIDGEIEEWPLERFGYGYRTSVLKQHEGTPTALGPIVLAAEFALMRSDPAELAAEIERTAAQRRAKTPAGQSCGSVFKNPAGDSAGRLIEAAGLKGATIGSAMIAEKHANYIVNHGGASSDDVLRLIDLARSTVLTQFGTELQLEVELLG